MYERSFYVQNIMDRLKRRAELKGIVSNSETQRLCQQLREILVDRANVSCQNDWFILHDYTQLCRRFTVAEANRIYVVYAHFKYPRVRPTGKRTN